MRLPRTATIVLAVCLFATPVVAQPLPQRDPQALVVLQAAVNAMGGVAAYQIQDSVTQATHTDLGRRPPTSSAITAKTRDPGKLRWDTSAAGPFRAFILNRGRGTRITLSGNRRVEDPNFRSKRADHLPVLLLVHEQARGDLIARYLGTALVEGRTAHRLRLARLFAGGTPLDEKLTRDSEIDIFIDTQTSLVLKASRIHLSHTDWRRGLPMEIYYGDYRNVGGIQVPFHQRVSLGGRPISEIRVTSFATNVGLPSAEFEGS